MPACAQGQLVSELQEDLERCHADLTAQDAALAALVEQHEAARAVASDSTDRSKVCCWALRRWALRVCSHGGGFYEPMRRVVALSPRVRRPSLALLWRILPGAFGPEGGSDGAVACAI